MFPKVVAYIILFSLRRVSHGITLLQAGSPIVHPISKNGGGVQSLYELRVDIFSMGPAHYMHQSGGYTGVLS